MPLDFTLPKDLPTGDQPVTTATPPTPTPATPAPATTAPATPAAPPVSPLFQLPPTLPTDDATPKPPPTTTPPTTTPQVDAQGRTLIEAPAGESPTGTRMVPVPQAGPTELRNQPSAFWQGLWDWHNAIFGNPHPAAFDQGNSATEVATHAMTFGFDATLQDNIAARSLAAQKNMPFDDALKQVQGERQEREALFAKQYPELYTIANAIGGAAGTGGLRSLYTAALGGSAALRNFVASVGIGGLTGFGMTEGDIWDKMRGAITGMGLSGLLHIGLGGVTKLAAPAVAPGETGQTRAGTILREQLDRGPGGPGQPLPPSGPAPVPRVPLNTPQATGSAEIAGMADEYYARNTSAQVHLRDEQNQRLLDAVPITQPAPGAERPVPQDTAGRASEAAVGKIREGADIIRTEENRLWNTPKLTDPNGISSGSTKSAVAAEVAHIRGLAGDAITLDGSQPLQAVLANVKSLPDKLAANQLNKISSDFRAIARDPGQDGNVRRLATRLANATQDGMANSAEVVGAPAGVPTGRMTLQRDANGVLAYRPEISGPIAPDPGLVSDLNAARAFTRREADVLGYNSFQQILRRNSFGNYDATEGTAMNKFFDFGNGVEKQGAIRDMNNFLDDIRQSWTTLRGQAGAGAYDPAAVEAVQRDLVLHTRDYIMSKMLAFNSLKGVDANGDALLDMGNLSKWIRTNRTMLTDSGAFDPNQLDVLDRIADTARMIHRGNTMGLPVNSATYSRLLRSMASEGHTSWVDLIGALSLGGAGSVFGFETGGLMHAIAEGAGFSLGGGFARTLVSNLTRASRAQTMEWLDRGIRDPDIARQLLQRVDQPNARPSMAFLNWMKSLGSTAVGEHAGAIYGAAQEQYPQLPEVGP